MITAKGVGFLAPTIMVFVLARLTQVGWLYLLDAVLWGIIILSVVLPWLGVGFLSAHRRLDHQASSKNVPGPSEGEQVRIELCLNNHAFWPRFFLNVFYDCPMAAPGSRLRKFFLAKLGHSSHTTMVSTVEAYQRGMHQLGPVVVDSSVPFGLFRRRVQFATPLSVLVYPQVYPLHRLSLLDDWQGMAPQYEKSRVGLETVGARHYFPGDPRRYIHWRTTARIGQPMVREFEDQKDQTLCLLFDALKVWGEGRETNLEYSIKVAASVADYALRHRASVRVWGGNLQGEVMASTGGGSVAWARLLKSLALLTPGEGRSLSETLGQLYPGSSAIVAVSIADRQSIDAILKVAPMLRQLVVVALEGFGEQDSEAADTLERAQVPLVRCRRGQLADALQTLEQSGSPASFRVPPDLYLETITYRV